jgi:hypothetical protein
MATEYVPTYAINEQGDKKDGIYIKISELPRNTAHLPLPT